MCFSLPMITAAIRLGIDSISFMINWSPCSLYNSFRTSACFSKTSIQVKGLSPKWIQWMWKHSLKYVHRFSIEFKLDDWAGHFIVDRHFVFKNLMTLVVVWHDMLMCMKRNVLSVTTVIKFESFAGSIKVLMKVTMLFCKISRYIDIAYFINN